ncbi:hypothetical protein ITJ55_09880 [Frigoribacterium sp. VKM Ac-1396]|uniref:hypothetical protein n=1 Tax=Frigoribacterium sp. VKM Ac-1396 TaxID=2783821 RepID=UPI00188AE8CC|nr:hypothetical protein [Frigoribacterium sp. VKM Ac-1396]MBF4601119.1 hypothetical protein [Frigoribacterium sp. VKM Ac-1396]
MNIESWGGGVVLALVAALWLVYLVPTWQRRREYLATERNAVRLQQTLRILAQTAEVPDEVRVEANARSVADAQKILRHEEARREALRRAHEAARQRAVTRELAAAAPVLRAADRDPALAARRLRRSRLVSTVVLALSVVAVVGGVAAGLTSSWVLVVAGLVFGGGSIAMLAQLAAVSRARARRAVVAPVAQPLKDFSGVMGEGVVVRDDEAAAESRLWTPVPVPKPLYLRRGRQRPAPAAATVDPAAVLRQDSRRSVESLRAAQHDALREAARAEAALQSTRRAPVTVAAPPAPAASAADAPAAPAEEARVEPVAPPRPQSRFARMGIIDELPQSAFSLDEALQRRRAV